ncbi:PorP/SprF family type IX secretion system membrane protein [Flavobacterium ardleyense]
MKTLLTVLTCIFSISLAFAQQDSQYTHYMYNTIVVNPGYAGSRGAMSLFAMHRNQWVGFDGAPKTNAFSIHTPFASSNIGAGLSFVNDQIGPTAENTITAAVSYTLIVSKKFSLNFGLNTSATFFNFYANKLNPKDVADTTLENFKNSISPNLGIGFYLHSDKTYFGLSAPQLFENYKYDDNELSLNRERINLYFITGTVIPINSDIDFKPAFLAKYLDSTPLQMDLSANFLFNQKLTLGAAYRYDAAVSALAGFQISEMLFVGYAYDFETTQLQKYNQGSHEIFLRFELFKSYSGLSSPRFF